MTREVVWSAAARDDYLEIIRYIADRNPYAALRLAQRLDRVISNLADMPLGRKGSVTGTFEKLVSASPYIVAYGVDPRPDGRERITVLHIIHAARDWPDEAWPQD